MLEEGRRRGTMLVINMIREGIGWFGDGKGYIWVGGLEG